jgi:hypothetical protein
MRSTTAILGGISMLFIGFFGLSFAAQGVETTALSGSNESQAAYNASVGIIDGIGQAAAPAVVWMGVAAIVLISGGYLVVVSQNGR